MSEPQFVSTYLKLEAREAVRDGAVPQGVELYQQYLALNQHDDDAWASLGGAYRRLQNINESIRHYQKAAQLNPRSTYALVNLISLLAVRNTPEDQRELQERLPMINQLTVEKTTNPGPEPWWCWYDLATIQLLESIFTPAKSDEVLKSFSYAIKLTPQTSKEIFRSVLSNLYFLRDHKANIPQLAVVIESLEQHAQNS